jgi:hypothetical protein
MMKERPGIILEIVYHEIRVVVPGSEKHVRQIIRTPDVTKRRTEHERLALAVPFRVHAIGFRVDTDKVGYGFPVVNEARLLVRAAVEVAGRDHGR